MLRQNLCIDTAGNVYWNGPLGNVPIKPALSDAVQYVSVNGNDNNDGLSWGTAKSTIAAAVAALPTATVTDAYFSPITAQFGCVNVASGTFPFSSGALINSPFVTIRGQGPIATVLRYTGSGSAIWFNPNHNVSEFVGGNGIRDLTIDGIAAGAGAIGLRTTDFSGFSLQNVGIRNFAGTGSVAWFNDTIHWYNEKMTISRLAMENNTVSWKISPASTSPGYPTTTFGYGVFDVEIMNLSGQTALLMTNGSLTFSILHLTVNQVSTPANATAIRLQNSAQFFSNTYAIHIESPGGIGTGSEVNIASGAVFAPGVGVFDQGTASSNVGTSFLGPMAYTAPLTTQVVASTDTQGNTTYATGFAATSGQNQHSPALTLTGNYWTGSASAKDKWQMFDFLGGGRNPASFLFVSHTGSSGSAIVSVPQLSIAPTGPTGANTVIKTPAGQSDFPSLTTPDFNGSLTGTVASGTATMTTAAIPAGACGTTVTVAARGALMTDSIKWSFNGAVGKNPGVLIVQQWPTANNVNFEYCNPTAGSVTPSAVAINWSVTR
jgi:hypothetical protein